MAPRCISRRRLTLAREPIGPPTFLGAGIGADPGRRQRGALPHLVTDRAKPGVIAVNQRAVRFVNESSSYHHFASAMQDAAENAPCFLLCDAQAMKRYGLGLARPAPVNNDALVAAGYLHKADTLAALAQQLGLDAQTLSETVARCNRDAARRAWIGNLLKAATAIIGRWAIRAISLTPVMPPAQRAVLCHQTLYRRSGDLTGPGHHRRCPGRQCQGNPIPGLYAVGNDMDSLMAGTLSGPRHHPRPGADVWLSRRLPSGTTLHPLIRENIMIYEKRTYTINPLKMADWLALYQSDALAVQNRPSRPANRLLFLPRSAWSIR